MSGSVTYEGVTFVKAACAALGKEEFVKRHIQAFWQGKDAKTRRKMLAEAWSLIAPPEEKEE